MTNALPISLETLACFILATALLHRYSDMVNNNIVTVVGVFISWFFSFMVIFLLPADLTSTAYRQCLINEANANSSTTTINPPPSNVSITTTPIPHSIPQHAMFTVNHTSDMIMPHNNLSASILAEPILYGLIGNSSSNSTTHICVTPWNYVPNNVLVKLWRFIYWSSQFLTWLLLPIMQSYSMAGDFTTRDKLKSALNANLIYYASFGAIFTVLLIYVIFKNGFDFANLKVIIISASNTWGLFLLVILLGYGLVELPRFLINRTKYFQSLSRQYFRVARLNAEKIEAEEKLDDVLEEIHHVVTIIGNNEQNPLKKHLDQIIDKCPPDWKRRSNAFRRQAAASNSIYEPDRSKMQEYDMQGLIRLHRKVIRAVHNHRQITCRWRNLIREVIEWEDVARNQIENNNSLSSRAFKSTLPKERTIFQTIYTPHVEWYWKCIIKIWLLRIIGFILATLSLAVVWSEIAFPLSIFSTKLSIFAYFVDSFQEAQQYFYLEIFSTISIGYLAICAFYTVFHMKIYNIYYLAPNKQTDEYSLLFSGMLVCRLTAPLCLNYLCLVNFDSHIFKRDSTLETSFTTIMGHLDLIPIVNSGLNIFLPLCISAICLAIYFDFGTRILHSLGFEQFIESDEMTTDWVQTGRELVTREKGKLIRNYESSSSTYHEMVTSSGETRSTTTTTTGGGNQLAGRPNKSTATQQQLPVAQTSIEFGLDGGSPSSHTSSSSGFSRSSLLPKDRVPTLSYPPTQSLSPSTRFADSTVSGRSGDNVVQIDMRTQQQQEQQQPGQQEVRKSKGFFDDV